MSPFSCNQLRRSPSVSSPAAYPSSRQYADRLHIDSQLHQTASVRIKRGFAQCIGFISPRPLKRWTFGLPFLVLIAQVRPLSLLPSARNKPLPEINTVERWQCDVNVTVFHHARKCFTNKAQSSVAMCRPSSPHPRGYRFCHNEAGSDRRCRIDTDRYRNIVHFLRSQHFAEETSQVLRILPFSGMIA